MNCLQIRINLVTLAEIGGAVEEEDEEEIGID
jgi:hypothetical protein